MADVRELVHLLLGIIGNIASCIFFLSSIPTALKIVRNKTPEGISGDLYIFKFFNCLLWTLYGLPIVHPHDFWVVLTNSIGCLISLIYLLIYLYFGSRIERWSAIWKLAVISSAFVLVAVLLLVLEKKHQVRILVVGVLCDIVSSCMHLTLLSQLEMTLKTKQVKYLHPKASVAAFIKGAIWTAYGIVDIELYIIIPNGIGIITGGIQSIVAILIWKEAQHHFLTSSTVAVCDSATQSRPGVRLSLTDKDTRLSITDKDTATAQSNNGSMNREDCEIQNIALRVPSNVQIRGIVPLDQ